MAGIQLTPRRGELRFLLLQARNLADPMRDHEVGCFIRALRVEENQIQVMDLLSGAPSPRELNTADVVLLGGSGDYSVAEGGTWLEPALDAMRELYDRSKPTFASCWGFQAMARAMGGEVVTDHDRAEVGTAWLRLTEAGRRDPVFGPLGDRFQVQIGHQDIVTRLPETATLLASSDLVENEAFCFDGKPIYCTQFHPELSREGLIARIRAYPEYLPLTGYDSIEELEAETPETLGTEAIVRRFLDQVVVLAA